MKNPIDIAIRTTETMFGTITRLAMGMFSFDRDNYSYSPYGTTPRPIPEVNLEQVNSEGSMTLDASVLLAHLLLDDMDIPEEITYCVPEMLTSYLKRGKFSKKFMQHFRSCHRNLLIDQGKIPIDLPNVKTGTWAAGNLVSVSRSYDLDIEMGPADKFFSRLIVLQDPDILLREMEQFITDACEEVLNA
jgi:hypothetical protein